MRFLGAPGQCAAQDDQKPGMLMANIQLKIKIFDAGPLFVYSITILLIRILPAPPTQFLAAISGPPVHLNRASHHLAAAAVI